LAPKKKSCALAPKHPGAIDLPLQKKACIRSTPNGHGLAFLNELRQRLFEICQRKWRQEPCAEWEAIFPISTQFIEMDRRKP
jgi:hypothetical protein